MNLFIANETFKSLPLAEVRQIINHKRDLQFNNFCSNFATRFSHRTLGKSKLRKDWQRRTMLMELVCKVQRWSVWLQQWRGFKPIKQR